MRIIWIEDSQVLKHTVRIYCEKYNVKCEYIANIDEFCKDFVRDITNDDLILLDILFDSTGERDKEGRGYEALECLKSVGKSMTPVVIQTVLDEDEVKHKVATFENVRKIIRKPVTPDELENALNEAWDWKMKQNEK